MPKANVGGGGQQRELIINYIPSVMEKNEFLILFNFNVNIKHNRQKVIIEKSNISLIELCVVKF